MTHATQRLQALCAALAVGALLSGCQNSLQANRASEPALLPAANHQQTPASTVAPSLQKQLHAGAAMPSWMRFRPMSDKGRIYVSMFNYTTVNEYAARNKRNAPPLCRIPSQNYVNGIGVDPSLDLWVPNAYASGLGFTAVFAPNCGKALFQIADQDGQPASIAFDYKKGNVYVENIYGPPLTLLGGNVDVYKIKSHHKVRVLKYQDPLTYIWSDEALDAAGDLVVVYSDIYNKGHVIEFLGGKNPATKLPISLGFPGGLTFDSAGNLLVADQDTAKVSVYAPPFTGSPIATFALQAPSVSCRFNLPRTHLYCSDFTNGSVDIYTYTSSNPSATKYLYSFNNGIPRNANNTGIALAPPPPN